MVTSSTEQQGAQLIDRYLNLAIRRKWEIILAGIPVMIAGVLFCLFATKVYRTSTTIIVVPQKVPEAYVRSTVTGDVRERIRGIWQEVTSRTNLEKVIRQFDLYPEKRKRLPMETVVEHMRNMIKIESPRNAKTNAFILSYEGTDPVLITKVTNSLANMFIEENLKLREAQARGTAQFLSQELEKVYGELKKREEALKQYKIQHMGELPEQRASNLATLNSLQQQSETLQENIRRAEDRKLLLQRQLVEEEGNLRASVSPGVSPGHGGSAAVQAPTTIEGLKERLKALRTRYTDAHPDVIAVKKLIARLEKEKGSNTAIGPSTPSGGKEAGQNEAPSATETEAPRENAIIVGLRYQIKSLDLEIKAMKEDGKKLREQIALYQKRLEETPKREQEMIDLTRDYDNLKRTYESLLTRKIEAEQAEALERRQKGEQFRVIDPARIPQTPVKPDVRKILAMTLVLALGAGAGLALGLEFLSDRLYDPDDVKAAFNLPVVACIPYLPTVEEQRKRRLKTLCLSAVAGIGYSMVLFLAIILWLKGAGALAYLV